jgi:hypothetical protein
MTRYCAYFSAVNCARPVNPSRGTHSRSPWRSTSIVDISVPLQHWFAARLTPHFSGAAAQANSFDRRRLSVAGSPTLTDAMMARSVRRHRPQSEPAPHAVATCWDVRAPFWTAFLTAWLVTARHRHTNIRSTSVATCAVSSDTRAIRPPAVSGLGDQPQSRLGTVAYPDAGIRL